MLKKIILLPYYLILKIRHALYDSGVWKVHTCEIPTICVGNIAAGGTGKTPHTEMILSTLLKSKDWAHKNIAVLSRGHKRSSGGFQQVTVKGPASFIGDEPLQIKKKFPEVTVAVDRSRLEGCDYLCHPEKLETTRKGRKCRTKKIPPSDIIVLDDAFQYRDLKAHVNIVLVDYNRPINKDNLLPFGRLRDLPERLHFADFIIVTKCPSYLEDWDKLNWIKSLEINDYDAKTCQGTDKKGKKITILFTSIQYCPIKPVYPEGDIRYIYSKKLILFSGIAKDTPLRQFLSDKYQVVKRFNFADHHKYSVIDIKRIMSAAKNYPTAIITTTEKDSQRVINYKKMPAALKEKLFQIPIQVGFLSEHEKNIFETTLMNRLREFHSES